MKQNLFRFAFYFFWFFCAIIQSSFTDLFNDEAYYWTYSKNLAWGYFDHPPFIALFIKLGSILLGFKNELSVRILMAVLNVGTIFIIEKLVKPTNFILFYTLISSLVFLHIGFLAIPDTPLLFFTALYFYLFVSYQRDENKYNIIGLSVAISFLLYSKYHGILPVLLTIISNLNLLKRKSFYIILLLSVILYIPHIVWLYEHEFITLKYHLIDRSLNSYRISNTLDFLIGIPFVFSGLSSLLLLYFCYKYIPKSPIEKTFKWNLFGTLVFFFVMTFKGRVEINWISISIIPMLIITFKYIEDSKKQYLKTLYSLSAVSILFIVMIRLFLMFDLSSGLIKSNFEFRNQKKWANQIKKQAHDLPVFFMDSYQQAAKYEFYANSPAFSLNSVTKRRNQYSIESEENYLGKTIFFLANSNKEGFESFKLNKEDVNYLIIDNYQSYSNIKLIPTSPLNRLSKNTDVNIKISIVNNFKNQPDLNANKNYPSFFSYQFFSKNQLFSEKNTRIRITNNMLNTEKLFTIHTPEKEGEYVLNLSIATGWLPPTINSENIKINIQ